jgi:hypothetical protein
MGAAKGREDILNQTAVTMRETLGTMWPMGMGSISIRQDTSMKVNGRTTYRTEEGRMPTQTRADTTDSSSIVGDTETEYLCRINASSKANL